MASWVGRVIGGGLSWVPGTSCFSGSQEVKPHMQMCSFQSRQRKAVGRKRVSSCQTHMPMLTVGHQEAAGCSAMPESLCSTRRDDNVQRELRDWGLSFDSNLLSFSGRILQSEKIHQGGKTVRLAW